MKLFHNTTIKIKMKLLYFKNLKPKVAQTLLPLPVYHGTSSTSRPTMTLVGGFIANLIHRTSEDIRM